MFLPWNFSLSFFNDKEREKKLDQKKISFSEFYQKISCVGGDRYFKMRF